MFERFNEARNNNLKFIQDFLKDQPDAVNQAFDYTTFSEDSVANFLTAGFKIAAIGGTAVVGIFALPYLLSATVILGAEVAALGWTLIEDDKTRLEMERRNGWTLLDFAAEGNAVEVAEFLILNDANLNCHFTKIATQHNHDAFLTACDKAIKQKANSLKGIERCHDLRLISYISKGAYGSVYEGQIANHKESVAIKIFKKEDHEESRREINILNFLTRHKAPNIMTFYGYGYNQSKDCYCMAMQYMKNGTLDTLIDQMNKQNKPFSLKQIVHFVKGVGQALQCIHNYKIVHRDVKLNNILLDDNNEAVLCDFGISSRLGLDKLEKDCRVAYWRPPEAMKTGVIGIEGDIYSLAFVAWSFVTLETTPFMNPGESYDKDVMESRVREKIIKNDERPSLPKNAHPSIHPLIYSMWATKPKDRPADAQVLSELNKLKI